MVLGYTLQYSSLCWDSGEIAPKDWIKRMTYAGDIYVDKEAFIKHVNDFLEGTFAEDYDNYYRDEEGNSKQNESYEIDEVAFKKTYGVTEEKLDNIKAGDYYLLFNKEEYASNWVVRCHNVI